MDESNEILGEVLHQLRALNGTLEQISDGLFHLNLHIGADVSAWTGGRTASMPTVPSSADGAGMVRGTIKWYDPERGFGSITPTDGGEDVFLHASVLPEGFVPREGQMVHCQVVNLDDGPAAVVVEVE